MGKLFGAVKHAAKDFSDDECMVSGAAIAYYTIFALPPLLVIVFFIAGMFGVPQQKIEQVVKEQLGLPATPIAGQEGQESQGAARPSGTSSSGASHVAHASAASAAIDEQPPSSTTSGPENSAGARDDSPPPPPLPEPAATRANSDALVNSDAAVRAPHPDEAAQHRPTSPSPRSPARTAVTAPENSRPSHTNGSMPDQAAGGNSKAVAAASTPPSQLKTSGTQAAQRGQGSEQSGQQSQQQTGGLETVASRAQSQKSPLSGLGPISKTIGILVLVFSATGVLAQLQHALNRAWEVEPDPEQSGIWSFIFKRVLSLGMIVVVAFLLLVSLVLTTLVDELVRLVTGGSSAMWATVIGVILNSLVTLAVATVLFATMFKLLPDARMRWKDTWVGAFITALLFVIGKSLLGWYLQSSNIGSTWGSAAASMIALLVWVYYSSLIVLFGAELAQVWAIRYGSGIEPAKGAVRIVEEKRHVRESAA